MEDELYSWLASRPSLVDNRSHPNHWHNRAADLRASAGALWHAMGSEDAAIAKELGFGSGYSMNVACWSVYHMLSGLSLELIMKAVLIQRGNKLKQVQTHSLHKLHQLLGINLDDERKQLLDFYEASVVWAGRYPIPRNPTDELLLNHYNLESKVLLKPSAMETHGSLKLMVSSDATDWKQYIKLWGEYGKLFVLD